MRKFALGMVLLVGCNTRNAADSQADQIEKLWLNIGSLEQQLLQLQELTGNLELNEEGDLVLRNSNFQIVSQDSERGNLIIGTNAPRLRCDGGTANGDPCTFDSECGGGTCTLPDFIRTGRHNIIVGPRHNYVGDGNIIVGENISVSGRNVLAVGYDKTVGDVESTSVNDARAWCVAAYTTCLE